MSIILDKNSRILIQGITGRDGSFHAKKINDYCGVVVGGVTPKKNGFTNKGFPLFDAVEKALLETDANSSIIFVPARFAPNAINEAIDAGIKTIIVVTEGIPVHEMIKIYKKASLKDVRIVGPNTPGMLIPGVILAGIIPPHITMCGDVGLVSRSGTLTYQILSDMKEDGFGVSTAIGVGGDQIVGTRLSEVVQMFGDDPETKTIVMIGEIGGNEEQKVAKLVRDGKIKKPIVAYIAGRNAPPEKKMGHAGAIIAGKGMSASEKIKELEDSGIKVARLPWQIPELLKEI